MLSVDNSVLHTKFMKIEDMGALFRKLKYGLAIISLLPVVYIILPLRSEWLNKRNAVTTHEYGYRYNKRRQSTNMIRISKQADVSDVNNASGVNETTMMRPLPTRGRVTLMSERCKSTNHRLLRQNLTRTLQNGGKATLFTNELFFCHIAKTGTNFFHHLLEDRYQGYVNVTAFMKNDTDKYTRVIFVREPFARLVSAYISKLFLVFPEWFAFNHYVSRFYRVKPSCGHDLEFCELIKFVLRELQEKGSADRHWVPHSARCLPCEVHYNFIGKLHTANDDVQMLIDIFKLPKTQTPEQYLAQYQRADIRTMLTRAFVGNNCTSIAQALERVWMVCQMRGVISHKVHFPYSAVTMDKRPNIRSFFNMIIKVRTQSPVTPKMKELVKKVVLRNAFSRIEVDDIQTIRELYYDDFYLYGYDMYPDFLTDKIPRTIDRWEPFKLKL